MTQSRIEEVVRNAAHLLVDFDGPVCAIFSGMPNHVVAGDLRDQLTAAGVLVPADVRDTGDPLEVFQAVAEVGDQAAEIAQRALTGLEILAAHTARPTDESTDLIVTARATGRTVAIVSNNSSAAIVAYLEDHRLTDSIAAIVGRDDPVPARMKPSPHRVREALSKLGAKPSQCVLVGDSTSDVTAAQAAGVTVIGYANKPGKADHLAHAAAEVVTTRLADISAALGATA